MPDKLNHDGILEIAVGRSRNETRWANKEILWSDFVKKISVTHRTPETYSAFLTSTAARQDEIKDVGGFVGGRLTGGRRKSGSVAHRQLVALDLDFAKADVWSSTTLLYGNAVAMYSTHKHSPEKPRLRLLFPLDRQVFADEYVAIARRIAGNIGIELFDTTTFQPERLMYWPSTSSDGEYLFEFQDGPWLSADEVLASYKDWTDSSEWPVSDKVGALVNRAMRKQGAPTEKPGLIGAFCRAYDIHEAIEQFLSDRYARCNVEGRYTYLEGSTAGGLVTYDDAFAYSHHGTDPASNKLCNAFDLVRIHLFGLDDEDSAPGTPANKLPSFKSMQEFVAADQRVRKLTGQERLAAALDAFSDTELEESASTEEGNDDWLTELEVDKKGKYMSTINNILTILSHDPLLANAIALDVFEQREVALRDLPWRKVSDDTRILSDRDDAGLRHYLEHAYGITSIQKIQDGLSIALLRNQVHPVREYLEGLTWDGERRIETLFIDYLGAEDSAYTRAVTRKVFAAAVARIFQPGVKFDHVLTFVGKQGIGKSSIIKKLGKQWFSDSFTTIQGKEAYEQIQGVWLIEMGELAGLKKAELETIKHFITKQEDRYRVAFGRRVAVFPRQCVFFGTTNNKDFLRDPTGNRRFWPVPTQVQPATKSPVGDDSDLTEYEVDQMWAEVVQIYKRGESLYLSGDLELDAKDMQEAHLEVDDRVGVVARYLNMLRPEGWEDMDIASRISYLNGTCGFDLEGVNRVERISVAEIWCEALGGKRIDLNRTNSRDIHAIMRSVPGWEYVGTMRCQVYGHQRVYTRLQEVRSKLSTLKCQVYGHQQVHTRASATKSNPVAEQEPGDKKSKLT